MIAGPACAAVLSGNNNIGVDVGNDNGAYLVTGNIYQLNLESDMTNLHIASDPSNSAGDITEAGSTSGTFYITCTDDERVFDDTVLMLAVKGTIADDFSVSITSSGYRWEVPAESGTLPEYDNLTYVSSALSETFSKDDLSYGPQTWKPSYSPDSPVYPGQGADDTFSIVFIDLNAGVLCYAENLSAPGDLTDGGAVKIDYTFENPGSLAVFNAYGLTNTTSAEIVTTNDASESLYSVLTKEDEAGPVPDSIEVSPSTASLEINETAIFTATAYDTEGSEIAGVTFNWSISDETIGNVTATGLFTGLSAGTVGVTASCGDASGTASVTVSGSEESGSEESTMTPMLLSASAAGAASTGSDPGTYGGVIPGTSDVYLKVANDDGARFNDFGDDTFHILWSGGGLNSCHISNGSSSGRYGELTNTNSMTGTFYVTETGGRQYHDEIFLCVAVNGTISDDFRIHITAEGYHWTPNATYHTPPVEEEIEYDTTLDEWFDKDDLIYGPQIWRPGPGGEYPIFTYYYNYDSGTNTDTFIGQDMSDTSNTFMMMFVDLNGGILSAHPLKVRYEIENLNTMAAFNVYGYGHSANAVNDYLTSWTNAMNADGNGPSGWTVSGAPLPDAASVEIDPVSASVPVNGKQQFTATAYDSDGNKISGAPVTWSVSDSSIGTISSGGLFTPLSEGSADVTATSGTVSKTAPVTVTAAVEKVLTKITLEPDSVLMYSDQVENQTFTATGYDQFGDEISAIYTWSSSIPEVGTIDSKGLFVGSSDGNTTIRATSGSKSGTATVEIKDHPDWEVTLIGAINRTLNRTDIINLGSSGNISYTDNRDLYWTGVNLTSVIGLFDDDDPSTFNTALASFDYNITLKGRASGNDKTVLITTFELTDTDDSFILGYLMDGYEVPEYPVDGRTYWPLKLTGSGIAGYGRNLEEITNITIELPPDVQRIGLTYDILKTTAGGLPIRFSAAAYDSDDIVIDYIPFTWSVSDSSIGTIDENGLFTPIKAGKVNVTASYYSVSGSVEVEVMDNIPSVKTWYVDQSGNGDFTSIQDTIDYGARDGDTIIVRDGTYEEKVTIDKSITLLSENGPNSTFIQNKATNLLDNMVTVTADDVTISGFNFSFVHNDNRYGALTIGSAKNTVISGNVFSDGYYAISGSGGYDATIEDNYFTSDGGTTSRTQYMMYLSSPKNFAIRNNTMDNFYKGIYIFGSGSGNLVENNTLYGLYDGGAMSATDGIHLVGSASSTVTNNYVSDCYYPLYLESDTDIIVFENYVDSGPGYEFYLYGCKNITAFDNFFGDGDYASLVMQSDENSVITNNSFGDSVQTASLYMMNEKDSVVSYNSFGDTGTYSLYMSGDKNTTVSYNSFGNSGSYSLYMALEENSNVSYNSFGDGGKYAIEFYKTLEDVTICNNEFGSGGDAVIYAYKTTALDGLSIYMNNFSDCTEGSKGFFYPRNSKVIPNLNSSSPMAYVYKDKTYTGFVGNLYNTYSGEDANGDGIGDTVFAKDDGISDSHPLVSSIDDYLILEAASVNITSPASTLKVGESMDFTASAIDQRGLDFPEAAIVFSSSNPAVGTIDSTGHFEALSHGTVTITASSGNAAASTKITVNKRTKKEETTNLDVSNCTIKGNGNGGSSVKVNSSSVTVVNNSICMQGSGFNLTILTSAAPVVNGGDIEGDIENIVLETTPVTADLQAPGNVSAGISLNLTGLPSGAGITTTISQDVDNDSQSAFQLAASEDGLILNSVAYTMNIVKTNLNNGDDIKDATITMAVGHAWVVKHGGYGSVKIIRFAEDGTKEVLDTVFVGTDGDMDVFEGYSPNGLSIFGLASTTSKQVPYSSSGAYGSSGGGTSDIGIDSAENLKAGDMATLYFDETSIYEMDLYAKTDISNLFVTVEAEKSPGGADTPEGDVYEYIAALLYDTQAENVSKATVRFDVPSEWVDGRLSSPDLLSLYYYNEGKDEWTKLSTVFDSEENGVCYYYADSASLGYFAIAAVPDIEQVSPVKSEVTGQPTPVGAEKSTASVTPTATAKATPLFGNMIIFVAFGLLCAIAVANRRCRKNKK